MVSQRYWCRRPLNLFAALLIAVAACVASGIGIFRPAEDWLAAARADILARPPSGELILVEIDARSIAEIAQWPWPRRYHGELVDALSAAGVALIAFDVDFSARSDDSNDRAFAQSMANAHVILPVFEQRATSASRDRVVSRPDSRFSSAWVGAVNVYPDSDGVVRDYPAATRVDGIVQPSLASLVAERDGTGGRSFQPDWAIDAAAIERISFIDVIRGRIAAERLRGKKILVGATAIEIGDRYAVPKYGVVPGVVIQALAAESLIQDRPVERSGPLVSGLMCLLIALVLRPRPVTNMLRTIVRYCAVTALVVGIPIAVQAARPLALDSAAWIFTIFIAAAAQWGIEVRRRLHYRSEVDLESGLPNRAVLARRLGDGGNQVLVLASIERFDAIREALGTGEASRIVAAAAQRISTHFGNMDVYRVSPDVLGWLQPDSDRAKARAMIARIQSVFRAPVVVDTGKVDIAFTFGLEDGELTDGATLRIERALSAIGTARAAGCSIDWYRGSDPQIRRELSMMGELRSAMQAGRLHLAYQPKLTIADGTIKDCEALIRWTGVDGVLVAPDEFIPLAEATGVISEVTEFALRSAAQDLARWKARGMTMRAAVNISALDVARPEFGDDVERILEQAGIAPSSLTLEITESALIRSPDEAAQNLRRLRERGLRLSVDDYGTGQSTLSYLKHLPVHELKIDRSFVMALADNASDEIMVRSTIDLAHELGLQVVAEGIEDDATLRILRRLGCDYAQGYFISRPVSAATLTDLALTAGRPRPGLQATG